MPDFIVRVTRDLTESCDISVTASSEQEAEEQALNTSTTDETLKWSIDEGNTLQPYVTDVREKLCVDLGSIDWKLLQKQKLKLLELIGNKEDDILEGLVSLIDRIQDEAEPISEQKE